MMIRRSIRSFSTFLKDRLILSEEVKNGLNQGHPIVALESTVITHGMPYPHNLDLGRSLEEIVRSESCIPATICLLDGKIFVGLDDEKLSKIAQKDNGAVKATTRDLPNVIIQGKIGGTTVASTMFIAQKAGIKVFATGGIGGVHRYVEESLDISADLIELSRTNVAVVSAGVKSILDIGKTLEFLETHGVNVLVYGNSPYFPGFYVPRTNFKAPFAYDSLERIAEVLDVSDQLGLKNGHLIACPIPDEYSANGEMIEAAIERATLEARDQGIQGKDVTPFLLRRLNELTKSASLHTNIELLKNNARIGAKLAKAYAKRKQNASQKPISISFTNPPGRSTSCKGEHKQEHSSSTPKILVVGASIVDYEVISHQDVKNDGGSYIGTMSQRCGGVGRNHADALTRLGNDVKFISAVGDDESGEYLLRKSSHMNLDHVLRLPNIPTATYLSINVKGNIQHGFSSIEENISKLTPDVIKSKESLFSEADFVLMDGNLRTDSLDMVTKLASFYKKGVWFDPADLAKVKKIFDVKCLDKISVISPNAYEFWNYCKLLGIPFSETSLTSSSSMLEFCQVNSSKGDLMQRLFPENLQLILITLGQEGVIALRRVEDGSNVEITQWPAPQFSLASLVSPSGAGDCFNAGFLSAQLMGLPFHDCMRIGTECAKLSLMSIEAVPSTITSQILG